MPSERVQRQIDRLLDEAEQAVAARDWPLLQTLAQDVLALEPANPDALAFQAAAERRLADAGEAPAPPGPLPGPPPRGEGTTIPTSFAGGRYLVRKFLGEGGKKRVYLAHDTTLDRDVAFALIKTDGLDDTARERIAREAQAMGRLGAHPHIVTVFDLGEEAGQPYMVTELMGGGDVEGVIERAPDHKLPLERALAIAEQVCQGLEFAHGQQIVHRDLKPGNVWLTEAIGSRQSSVGGDSLSLAGEGQGEGETQAGARARGLGTAVAKIGDFGLAVAIDRTRLTQAGMMVGTVSYMPPEQATGGEVTPRSDLYSLGAMLYELVTGRPPFVGDEAVAIIGQHLNTPPVAPSWHRPDCPPGLEALILRLLEKDPSKRPSSAGEVREALGRILRQAQDERRQRATGRTGASLSLAGEGQGEGEGQAPDHAQAALDNPLYRRAFVGRESELRQLQAAFDAALSGRGSLAMVVGEPGIGKTSVCEQLATYAALRGGKALVGHCYEEGSLSLPYLPFVEAMRSYVLAREPDGLKNDLGSGAGEVARIVSEVRDRVQVTPAESGDAEEQRWRLLQAVSGFLRNASQVQPLLIILEDLHDADRGTLDLLVHLSRNLDGARLLIVGTYRDVEVDRSHPLSSALAELRRGQNFRRVPLRGLTAEEVQRMMTSVSQREIPWPFAELVHRQTEGNPLFVQEMLRYLVEEGLVSEQAGSLRGVGDDPLAGRIPEGLRDVIGKRLSRLADKTNQVLSIASVVGREFRLDVLQTVASLPQDEVEAALEEAGNIAVVEQRTGVGGQLSFRFTHAFFRQTLYEELFAARRIRLHQQVARALETVYGRRVDEHAAELAEHYSNSSDPADLGKAVEYGEVAARRAMGVFAYGEAARHLEQALKAQDVLQPDDKLRRCDLLLALGEALGPAGEPLRAAEEIAPEALELAEALQDRARAFRACRGALAAYRRYGGGTAFRRPAYQRWAETIGQYARPGTAEEAQACAYQANGWWAAGRRVEAWALHLRAVDLSRRHGDPALCFEVTDRVAIGSGAAPEDETVRREVIEEVLALPREGVSAVNLSTVLLYGGAVRLAGGDRSGAEALFDEIDQLAERTRDPFAILVSLFTSALRATVDGDLEAATAVAATLEERAAALGMEVYGQMQARFAAFTARLYLGQADAVLEDATLALSDPLPTVAPPPSFERLLALAHLGREAEARAVLIERYGEHARHADDSNMSTTVLVNLLEAAVLLRDAEAAATAGRRLERLHDQLSPNPNNSTAIARHLGGASALLGDRGQARAYYEEALEVSGRIRHRPEIALAHLALAELLLEGTPGERAEALEHLDSAITELRDMKMQPSLERALRHKELLEA